MINGKFQRALSWFLAGLLAFFLYKIIKPFLVPLVWASVLAIFLFPLHCRMVRLFSRPNLAALLTVAVVAVLLVLPVVLIVPAIIEEAISFLAWLRSGDVFAKLDGLMRRHLSTLPVSFESLHGIVMDLSRTVGAFLAQQSARFAGNVAWFLFDLLFMLLAMFYLLREGHLITRIVGDISPLSGQGHERLSDKVAEMVQVTILSSFVVAAVQGVLGGLTFWLLSVPSPALWAVVMAVMALLPVAGPWLVWGPVAAVMILAGDTARGIALLIAGFLLVSGADNVLRPVLIAGRSQLNGLLVFVSVLGGIQAFGFVGVVLGPVLVATAVGLLRGYRQTLLG